MRSFYLYDCFEPAIVNILYSSYSYLYNSLYKIFDCHYCDISVDFASRIVLGEMPYTFLNARLKLLALL